MPRGRGTRSPEVPEFNARNPGLAIREGDFVTSANGVPCRSKRKMIWFIRERRAELVLTLKREVEETDDSNQSEAGT